MPRGQRMSKHALVGSPESSGMPDGVNRRLFPPALSLPACVQSERDSPYGGDGLGRLPASCKAVRRNHWRSASMRTYLEVERRAEEPFLVLLSAQQSLVCRSERYIPGSSSLPPRHRRSAAIAPNSGTKIAGQEAEPSSRTTRQAANVLSGKQFRFAIAKSHLTRTKPAQGNFRPPGR